MRFKIRHFADVDQINYSKILDLICNFRQNLILLHAGRVPIMSKPEHHHPIFLRQYCLINRPARTQMGQQVTHYQNKHTKLYYVLKGQKTEHTEDKKKRQGRLALYLQARGRKLAGS
eukprot:TRINITY_DN3954_c0_g1_i2.p1 TRINITY_DN3954_c0_g1~~TRINITY_DN3954_c0_g1_i2.p1  ORF type:complete len:117 (-),score=0.13 TRINITY_DN3954_c0_g1_i2:37-387(-)